MSSKQVREMPVYLFTGFLEAGKTTFLNETLADPQFNAGEPTLVLLTEEGEVEPDLSGKNCAAVRVETLTEEDALSPDRLASRAKRAGAERVIVEYNGMWQISSLYNALPESWLLYQQIAFFDATTVLSYNANMRALVVDKLQGADLVVFNRVAAGADTMDLHKLVRALNRRANIIYEAVDHSIAYDEIEDPLPFDLDAPIIDIADRDFAIFMRDLTEETEKYDGKTVRFTGLISRAGGVPRDTLVIGRHVMTCCVADIQYNGLVCVTPRAEEFSTYDWATVTAKIALERHKIYRGRGPVLHATAITRRDPLPENERVATFY